MLPAMPTDGLGLIDPSAYGARGVPHDTWIRLRRESPLHPCQPPGYGPFWAVTKHGDVVEISRNPQGA